jgi:CTP synthase (UTP-ammonia lyase)
MNYTEQTLNKRDLQQKINSTAKRDIALGNDWLRNNGISEKQLQAGLPEILQAQRLATTVLRNFGKFLAQNQTQSLQSFLKKSNNAKQRLKITLGQCFTVMNITKEAQRRFSKKQKAMQRNNTITH